MLVLRLLPVATLVMGFAVVYGQTVAFSPAVTYAAGSAPKLTLVGDFTGDGIKDLGVLTNVFGVLPGLGNGTFGAPLFSPVGGASVNAAAGDFNEDGTLDIAYLDAGLLSIYSNSGGGAMSLFASYLTVASPKHLVVVDADGDTHLDVVVASQTLPSGTFLKGVGNGTFLPGVSFTIPVTQPFAISTGDYTGDGRPDLSFLGSTNRVGVVNWSGSAYVAGTNFLVTSSPTSLASPYFDGDNFADIVVGNTFSQLFSYRSTGAAFVAGTNVIVGGSGGAAITADLNSDGRADIVTTWQSGNQIVHTQGNGTMGFGGSGVAGVPTGPVHIASGDLNGDGRPDLVTTGATSSTISVLLNAMTRNIVVQVSPGDWISPFVAIPVQLTLKSGTTTLQSASIVLSGVSSYSMPTTALVPLPSRRSPPTGCAAPCRSPSPTRVRRSCST